MARSDAEWRADMLRAIADIRADTAGMDVTTFAARPAIIRSVLFSIAVMGEAAKNTSPAGRAAHPDVPWRAIAGMRDRIVHEYFRTNTQRVWDVVASDLEALEAALGGTGEGGGSGRGDG
jgi:uncharacterized protein with HEPN domain